MCGFADFRDVRWHRASPGIGEQPMMESVVSYSPLPRKKPVLGRNFRQVAGVRRSLGRGAKMSARTLLIILIILLLIGALPTWPYSTAWGYYPSGGLGLVLLIVIVVALFG